MRRRALRPGSPTPPRGDGRARGVFNRSLTLGRYPTTHTRRHTPAIRPIAEGQDSGRRIKTRLASGRRGIGALPSGMTYPIGATWRSDGFSLRVVDRAGNRLLVEKRGGKNGGNYLGFEVAVVAPHGPREFAGRSIPAGESYPGAEDWGQRGWTYPSFRAATRRFSAKSA